MTSWLPLPTAPIVLSQLLACADHTSPTPPPTPALGPCAPSASLARDVPSAQGTATPLPLPPSGSLRAGECPHSSPAAPVPALTPLSGHCPWWPGKLREGRAGSLAPAESPASASTAWSRAGVWGTQVVQSMAEGRRSSLLIPRPDPAPHLQGSGACFLLVRSLVLPLNTCDLCDPVGSGPPHSLTLDLPHPPPSHTY